MTRLTSAIAASLRDLDAATEAAGDEWPPGYQTEAEILLIFLEQNGVSLKMSHPPQEGRKDAPFEYADEHTIIDLRQFMKGRSHLTEDIQLNVFNTHPTIITQALRSAVEYGREISRGVSKTHISPTGEPYKTVRIGAFVDDDEDVMTGLLKAIEEYKMFHRGKIYWRVFPIFKINFDHYYNRNRVELSMRLLISGKSVPSNLGELS